MVRTIIEITEEACGMGEKSAELAIAFWESNAEELIKFGQGISFDFYFRILARSILESRTELPIELIDNITRISQYLSEIKKSIQTRNATIAAIIFEEPPLDLKGNGILLDICQSTTRDPLLRTMREMRIAPLGAVGVELPLGAIYRPQTGPAGAGIVMNTINDIKISAVPVEVVKESQTDILQGKRSTELPNGYIARLLHRYLGQFGNMPTAGEIFKALQDVGAAFTNLKLTSVTAQRLNIGRLNAILSQSDISHEITDEVRAGGYIGTGSWAAQGLQIDSKDDQGKRVDLVDALRGLMGRDFPADVFKTKLHANLLKARKPFTFGLEFMTVSSNDEQKLFLPSYSSNLQHASTDPVIYTDRFLADIWPDNETTLVVNVERLSMPR